MRRARREALLLVFSLLAAVRGLAAPYSVDWKTPGDGLLTRTGNLEFLDLGQAMTPDGYSLTRNQVAAELAPGGLFDGFRYATRDDLIQLLTDAGSLSGNAYSDYYPNQALLDLVGVTGGASSFVWAYGITSSDNWCVYGFNVQIPGNRGYSNVLTSCDGDHATDPDARWFQYSHWLVRGQAAPTEIQINVVSNRPDLISAGDVLIEVAVPQGAPASSVTLLANGSPAEASYGVNAAGRYLARVTGLALGVNVLTAQRNGTEASVTVVNHPNGGPVFSGPQIQPWICQSGAVDAQCNQPPEYTLLYKSTDATQTTLLPYDPQNPPTDVATTTTDQNVTLPFIVRQERGYQDRDEYKILTLFQPGQPWEPWAAQPQWNHKLLITGGGGCGNGYGASSAPLKDFSGTFPDNPGMTDSYIAALGRGFAVMSTALDNTGHDCNIVTEAESLIMAKERLVEQYGELRYAIGTGCSGGSVVQQQVSNAYPGVYQGLLVTCAYPDVFSAGAQFADYHMLRTYFEDPSKWGLGVAWSPQNMADVDGHATHANAIVADEGLFKGATNPSGSCVSSELVYDADSNPGGVRCGLLDYMKTVLGPRPPAVWSPSEQAVGHGFGGSFIDNVGIQYGLEALQQLKITPAQFVDLNVAIGGLDIDIQPSATRIHADQPALANAYRSGAIDDGSHLDTVAIIDGYGPDPGAAHDTVHTWWMRWRLDREQGHHDNHVIWAGPAALIGDPNYPVQSLIAMDRWLAAIEQDTSDTPLAQKVVGHRPADIHDQCSDGNGNKILDDICPGIPVFGTPRTVAGDVNTADTMKCQLKPLNRADDYGPLGALTFTDDQWAQLVAAYPEGVCDYSQPAVDFQPTIPWLTYQESSGSVIYGGTPLAPAPVGVAPGWVSDAFYVPEPGRGGLLAAGIGLLLVLARRRGGFRG